MNDELKNKLERFYKRQNFGIKMGLEVTHLMLEKLGNPHHEFASIHVAGTNGKGSVCAMIESILREHGMKTGLYTSPHLVKFNERIKINGADISDHDLESIVDRVEKIAGEVADEAGREPTFFECATAVAFECFRRSGVQIAVVETGLGGRLDSTNVLIPVLSVITGISLEHTSYLGDTVDKIAAEKAGIIKKGHPVVTGRLSDQAMRVIKDAARKQQATVVEALKMVTLSLKKMSADRQDVIAETENISYGTIHMGLIGNHQLDNLAVVLAVVDVLNVIGFEVSEESVKAGVANTKWAGRFQLVKTDPPIIVDCAHNPEAAGVLLDTIKQVFEKRPVCLVFGMCNDKDEVSFLKSFSGRARKLWLVPVNNERNIEPQRVFNAARAAGIEAVQSDLDSAVSAAEKWAVENGGVVCITGSIFMVGDYIGRIGNV